MASPGGCTTTLTGFLENPDAEGDDRVEQKDLIYSKKRPKPQEERQKVPIKVVYIRRKKGREDIKGNKLSTDDFFVETDNSDAKMCTLYREYDVRHFLVIHFDLSTPSHVVTTVLKSGFRVRVTVGKQQSRHFVFFGHSASQLRERTCVLYDHQTLGPWEGLVNRFGEFETIKNPSKRAARIGLLLSTATKCLELDEQEIDNIKDIERDGHTFTDGCGFISVACARKIMEEKDISVRYEHQDPPVPSVIQFRMKGCKGVVMVDPCLPHGVCIRPSQEKFKWKLPSPHIFGVCDDGISQPYAFGQLNKQYIMMLSALGIKDDVFLSKQETYFQELDRLETDKEVAFRHLCARGYIGLAERLFSRHDGPDNETVEILRGFRSRVRRPPKANKVHKLLNTKPEPARALKIPIEKSRNVFGVCDPSGKLQPGQCFFQATVRGKTQVLADTRVAVVKCPCYHPGDFRVLECVNVEECRHLVDCIVFPVQGERPHADEIAGSDLDGDKFFVCWDPDLVPDREEEPLPYPGGEAAKKEHVTSDDLISGFANYNSRTVSRLNELFNRWADVKGVKSSECHNIAKLFATAVDTAKTGKGVVIPRRLLKPPEAQEAKYVWQKMLERATLYLADSVATDTDLTVKVFEEPDITDLLNNKDINVSEYQLFRFLYKWCESNNCLCDLQRYVGLIDFTRFTAAQKARVVVDCPELPVEYLANAFYRSRILTESDIQRMDIMSPNQWSLFFRESDEDISWPTIRSVLTSETPKLLIFKFRLGGTDLVMGLCLPGPLVMNDVVTTDESSGRPTVVFFSDHSGGGIEMVDLQDGHRSDDYLLELDLEHLQIYNVRRTRTFVWLRWDDEFEAVRMSVALDRFPGERRDRSVKLQKEEVQSVEVFYQVASMQRSPSVFTERGQQQGFSEEPPQETSEETDVDDKTFDLDVGNRREFPELGVEPEEILSEEAERLRTFESMCEAVCVDGEAGTLTSDSLHQIIDLFGELPEAALRLESLIWKYRDQIHLRPDTKEKYYNLLINIVSMTSCVCVQSIANANEEATLERIRRFCRTLERDGVVFGLDRLRQLFTHLQYASVDCTNSLLDMIRDGIFPINQADFVPGRVDYYLHWTALCTMEAREEVCSCRGRALRAREDEMSVIRVEEYDGRYIIADWETNELSLSVGDQLQIAALPSTETTPSIIVTEVSIDMTEHELKVLWSSDGSQRVAPGRFTAVHIGNGISHKRLLAALDSLCVQTDSDAPSNLICERIISSFGGGVDTLASISRQNDDESRLAADDNRGAAEAVAEETAASAGPTDDGDLQTDAPLQQQRTEAPSGDGTRDSGADVRPKKRWGTKGVLNRSQEEAVQTALTSEITLIQGPPGTGKTKAAAEVIVRWQGQSDDKILAVAETNEGVDNIIQKLLDSNVPQEDILRLGQLEKVRYELRHLSLDKRYDEKFGSEDSRGGRKKTQGIKAIVSKAKIICTTCIGAGSQMLQQMTFSRVLVDEAAQATEPAVLCALSHGCRQVCLIGDDQQLPPLVQCEDAQELKISLFERWRGQKFQVHLLDTQYRMHPAISAFPSNHFYKGQIQDGIEASNRTPPSGFNWPIQNLPVSFINTSSSSRNKPRDTSRETSRGTSKFNDKEVSIVIDVTKRLVEGGGIRERDIGIVSPYKAQISRIRKDLEQHNLHIATRSVDGFQGQERDVIIFSAVRANDGGYVGFLNDPRRMNVLLTRARRGLIVVGHGDTLQKGSDDWKKWIQWIREKKLEQEWTDAEGCKQASQAYANSARNKDGTGWRGGARGGGRGQRGRGYRGVGAGRGRRGRGNTWQQ